MISTTNFIGSDGVDLGSKLLEKEYFNSVYLNIANQYITPELWGWGINDQIQIGDNAANSLGNKTPKTTFAGGANWKQIFCSVNHTAAVKTDGSLWVWGSQINGLLGNNVNNVATTSTPITTFSGGTNWKQVSCGVYHTAAIKTDGTLWVWGISGNGQLGTNNPFTVLTPVTTFSGGTNWSSVSTKNNFSAAIKTDGSLWVWGINTYGQLGTNDATTRSTPVTTFAGGNNWKQVSCGLDHMAAIKNDGSLWTWGRNTGFGALGINFNVLARPTPVTTFAGGNDWKQVSCGYQYTMAIKRDGSLWAWGRNLEGNLGDNTTVTRSTPVTTFAGGNNWKTVSISRASAMTSYALKTDGTMWTWGNNTWGQLGNGSYSDSLTPVTNVLGGNNWRSVSAGYKFAMAIRSYEE